MNLTDLIGAVSAGSAAIYGCKLSKLDGYGRKDETRARQGADMESAEGTGKNGRNLRPADKPTSEPVSQKPNHFKGGENTKKGTVILALIVIVFLSIAGVYLATKATNITIVENTLKENYLEEVRNRETAYILKEQQIQQLKLEIEQVQIYSPSDYSVMRTKLENAKSFLNPGDYSIFRTILERAYDNFKATHFPVG